ncbi:glycosyltransferase [Dokdonia sp. Hel_I_53]|uniref:glycosyltransferase n=1 Tax=Dokdonia sp. Hel_I_53 TaxID=1566287 RepID=UPI00119A8555|nr:glycosyltransferase [Dokdonia sp. Hel_I_53]TVZ52080.1 cellulose synthase/poly-beta-1,6-N-acetylglucosamine synthase-like glycosyltransferase [Dokdonia sp. Hel_I_53]
MEQLNTLLFYIFLGATIINVAFYLFYSRFAFAKAEKSKHKITPPISVLVCAKNEEGNLKNNIPKVLEQEYPCFEVILINDASTDKTGEVIEDFALSDARVKELQVRYNEKFWGNKKYALTLGIKKATYEHLVFIDADCVPASKNWLALMASQFVPQKEIVLGYGGYSKIKGSGLNKLIRFETVNTAIQYFSWALAGKAYMGVGRNLSYTSGLFYKHNGFSKHMSIRGGDDDLFVSEAATSINVSVQEDPESFTYSFPKESFSDWLIQKRRHISTSSHYKGLHQFFLGIFFLSQLLFICLMIPVITFVEEHYIVLLIILIRYSITWSVTVMAGVKFREKDILIFYPILEIGLVCVQLGIFITNLISKPKRWK